MLRLVFSVVLTFMVGQFACNAVLAANETETAATPGEADPDPAVERPTVLETLEKTPGLGLFRNLIWMAGSPDIFSDGGPMTVFVPPDDVLIKEFNDYMAGASGEAYQQRLKKLVLSHVLRAQYSQDDLRYNITMVGGRDNVQTVSGDALTLRISDDRIVVFDERHDTVPILKSILAKDGVIHELDGGMLRAR